MAKGNFIEYVISDDPNKYPNESEQDGYYYRKVMKVETEEQTITAGTTPIEVIPSEGKLISKVNINPTPTEEKTVTPTTEDLVVTPVEGKQLSQVTVQGDANFLEENIAEGVTMWGKTGTAKSGGSGPYKTSLLYAGTDENGYTTYIPDQYPYEYIQNILSTKDAMLCFGISSVLRPCIFVGFLSQSPASVEFTYLDLGLSEAGFGWIDDKTGQITVDQPSSSFDGGLLDNAYIFYYDVL